MMSHSIVLPSKLKTITEDSTKGIFEIEGLYPGYGHTLGNSLRRIILSSIPGSAITHVKIKGADHEFSTVAGVREDAMTIILNLKKVRFQVTGEGAQTASLSVKSGTVTAKDFKTAGGLVVVSPDQYIAEVSGKGELTIDVTVEQGMGFVPREMLSKEKVDIGTIMLDARFSPIVGCSYDVEDMRVGDRTNYNRLRITIETDGSLAPADALEQSMKIMLEQFRTILDLKEFETKRVEMAAEPSEPAAASIASAPARSEEDITEILKTRIDSLQLSTRTLNALGDAGIRTVGGLIQKTEAGLLELDGFGEKGLTEVKEILGGFGLALKD